MRTAAEEVSTSGLVDTKRAARLAKRRNWPEAFKRQVVAETLEPGSSVSIVAAARSEHEPAVQMAARAAAEGAAYGGGDRLGAGRDRGGTGASAAAQAGRASGIY